MIERSLNPSSSTNQRVLRNLFPRPDVITVSHFTVIVYVDVKLQDGQDAAQESEEKQSPLTFPVLITEGVTNLSAPIWFTGQGHCTVFLSRDAIIAVGPVLENHFDGGFTPDQEKEIALKRWPPGYQS